MKFLQCLVIGSLRLADDITTVLKTSGAMVTVAPTAADGIAKTRQSAFDVVLVEKGLADCPAMEAIRTLTGLTEARVVLIGASVTLGEAVAAMRSGADDVIDTRPTLSQLEDCLRSWCANGAPAVAGTGRFVGSSVFTRWAGYVAGACSAPGDLKTIQDWARHIGASYTTLRECCLLVGVRPQNARDLARALRALRQAHDQQCVPGVFLNIADRRTLESFIRKAGPHFDLVSCAAPELFIETQGFVACEPATVSLLKTHVQAYWHHLPRAGQ